MAPVPRIRSSASLPYPPSTRRGTRTTNDEPTAQPGVSPRGSGREPRRQHPMGLARVRCSPGTRRSPHRPLHPRSSSGRTCFARHGQGDTVLRAHGEPIPPAVARVQPSRNDGRRRWPAQRVPCSDRSPARGPATQPARCERARGRAERSHPRSTCPRDGRLVSIHPRARRPRDCEPPGRVAGEQGRGPAL